MTLRYFRRERIVYTHYFLWKIRIILVVRMIDYLIAHIFQTKLIPDSFDSHLIHSYYFCDS